MVRLKLKAGLEAFLKKNPPSSSPNGLEEKIEKEFNAIVNKRLSRLKESNPSYAEIPPFFSIASLEANENMDSIAVRATQARLQRKAEDEVLTDVELQKVWEQLKAFKSLPEDGNQRVNYESFLRVGAAVTSKCATFFSALTFLRFDRDEYGRIDSLSLFEAISRKNALLKMRVRAARYDSNGFGFLSDTDLLSFLKDYICEVDEDVGESIDRRLIVAKEKFAFFLDPRGTGKFFLNEMVISPVFAELEDLREQTNVDDLVENWFSAQNAARFCELFDRLDEDADGMIKGEQLIGFKPGFTAMFLSAAAEHLSTESDSFLINFQAFVRFVLIVENRQTPQAIAFLFKCADFLAEGKLDAFVVAALFKGVLQRLMLRDPEADKNYRIEDVREEVFDMVAPSDPNFITLQDLQACGQGDTVLSILLDAKAFLDYDQREVVATGSDEMHKETMPDSRLLTNDAI